MTDIVVENELNETNETALIERIQEYVNKHSVSVDWGYDSKLSNEQVQDILTRGREALWDIESELMEYNIDYIWELERYQFEDAVEHFDDELLELFEQNPDNYEPELLTSKTARAIWIDDHVYSNIDMNMREVLNNTPVKINCNIKITEPDLHIYEMAYIGSGWAIGSKHVDYRDSNHPQLTKLLGINPRIIGDNYGLKKTEWPHYPNRKPKVNPDLFLNELANNTSEWVYLTAPLTCDLEWYCDNFDTIHKDGIVLKKQTTLIFHDTMNGSCSIGEMYLTEDLTLKPDKFDFHIDGERGYGLDQIMGVGRGFWDGVFDLVSPKTKKQGGGE